jgi:hypothetical protein
MGVSGTSEEAFLASEISTKNNGWVEWAWGRQPMSYGNYLSGAIEG